MNGINIKLCFSSSKIKKILVFALGLLILPFQNCAEVVNFSTDESLIPLCREIGSEEVKPVLKYGWDPSKTVLPQFDQVMASPAVGDIDGDGIPEIVFVTFTRDQDSWFRDSQANVALHRRNGVLRVVDGRSGLTKYSVDDSERAPMGDTMPLLIDIDGDGKVEIVFMHYTGTKVIALNFDGQMRWSIGVQFTSCTGGMAATDLDADGRAELIVNNIVIGENASREPYLRHKLAGAVGICTSFAASLDPGRPEQISIINNDGVFSANGKQEFRLASSGFNATADVRPEIPGLEIIQSGGGHLAMYNGLTGEPIFQKSLSEYTELVCAHGSVGGGVPTVGDFKGDGSIQIAVATGRSLTIFDQYGNKIAGSSTKDCSSLSTGITSFDFNGDGKPEIIYGDENYLRIYHMNSSANLVPIHEILNPSGTLLEYPVVVDVDGDHLSELVVVSNNYGVHRLYEDPSIAEEAKGITGLRVFKPQIDRSWMPTRSVWNQYAYFVNNVFDTLVATSKTISSNNALNQSFRRNSQGLNSSLSCRN